MQEDIIDRFTGPALDSSRWRFLEYPLPDGGSWVCREASARTRVAAGRVDIEIDRFENAYGGHQNMDNVKHLLLSTQTSPVPAQGVTAFHCTMRARSLGATPRDYRDGFASFNVLDFSTGMVFDICATSDQLFAIHERLPLPGVEDPFTWIVDAPLAGLAPRPDADYQCSVRFAPEAGTVEWWVDGRRLYRATERLIPEAVTLAFGFISLHPCREGKSHSLHGQGMHASWSGLRRTWTPP